MERQGTLKKTKKKIVSASRQKASSIAHIRGSIRKRRQRHNLSDASSLDHQRSPSGSLTTDDDDSVQDINDISLRVEPVVVHGAERLSKLSYCGDYSRLRLGNIAKDSSIGPWRICMVNVTYTACRSYPSVVVVPQSISDDSILRIAKNHRQGRFPVAVWRHQRNKATLLRAGGIERSTIGSIMRQHKSVGSNTSVASHAISSSASVEQEKYLAAVVAATPQGKNKQIARANSLHHGVILRDGYFADDVDSGQLVDKTIMKKGWEPAALYIFGDKTLLRHVKQEAYPKCEFVPIELPDIRAVRASFKKFQRATCPSTETNLSFIQQVEESEWLQQLSAIMTVANCLVDLIDIQGSSVLVCFEDGWDATPQVLSLAEIMLDSHYRTIDGFKLLIEKEWLSFGHRFTHRGCQIASAQAGFTPIFLQFLDCVHQIMLQFPLSFEFNDQFLSTIAYHHVSMRFRTFLLDSEHERSESGWMAEEDHKPRGKSLWDYMDLQKSKSPLYNNFLFSPNQHKVLRPFCKVPNLKVWKYYTTENLSTGPTYDLELINDVTTTTGNEQSADGKQETYGSCMTGCYGDVTQFNNDGCSWLLQELYRLEEEADQKPKKWEQHWHKLSYPSTKRTHFPVNSRWFSSQRLMLHKRSTMEVILKGKLQVEERGAKGFSQPHNFVPHLFVPPSNCDHCYQMIIGILNKGAKCTECGYNCHERCQPQVPWQCKKPDLPEQPGSGVTKSTLSIPSETDAAGNPKKLHCGHLYKRGHLLRQWKARWFVLDTPRNQLRYYDGEHDQHLQGYVDLGEMIAVQALSNVPPGAPKGSEKGAFFDLRTTKRVYNLMCESRREAEVWVEKLQNMNV